MPGGLDRYYNIVFHFGEIDLSLMLDQVDILYTMSSVYPIVTIKFKCDSQQLTQEELYGQSDCKVEIMLTTESAEVLDMIELDLLVIKPNMDYGSKSEVTPQDHPRSNNISLICIPKAAFETMSTTINYTFPYDNPMYPVDAVSKLVQIFTPNAKPMIDKNNHNDEPMYQMIVPPMSLSRAIPYIDFYHAIYKGPLFYFTTWDNKFTMCDLSFIIQQTEIYTVHFLSRGKKDNDIYDDIAQNQDTVFYTYTPFQTDYAGNQMKMVEGGKLIGVAKPSDNLFHQTSTTAQQVFDDNAPKDSGKFLSHDQLKNRVTVANTLYTGSEYSDTIIRSRMASKIAKMSKFKFKLDRNIFLKNVLNVGIPISLIPENMSYQGHAGKYLVSETHVTLTKDATSFFNCVAEISVVRANILT